MMSAALKFLVSSVIIDRRINYGKIQHNRRP